MARRLLAIVTDDPIGPEPLREIRRGGAPGQDNEVNLRVVVPAVEASAFRHTLGDVDEPTRDAEARLEREQAQARWFEEALMEKAEAGLDPPLRMVVLHSDRDGTEHVVGVETSGPGTRDPAEGHEIASAYLPGLSRGDFAGMVVGIFGTIVTAILAGAVAVDNGRGDRPCRRRDPDRDRNRPGQHGPCRRTDADGERPLPRARGDVGRSRQSFRA